MWTSKTEPFENADVINDNGNMRMLHRVSSVSSSVSRGTVFKFIPIWVDDENHTETIVWSETISCVFETSIRAYSLISSFKCLHSNCVILSKAFCCLVVVPVEYRRSWTSNHAVRALWYQHHQFWWSHLAPPVSVKLLIKKTFQLQCVQQYQPVKQYNRQETWSII